MYNIYIEEKQLQDANEKKKQEEKKEIYKKKHQKKLELMYENYENRVKNFITDMTLPNQSIILKDNPKIFNSRATMMNEGKILKSFVFKGYKTEKDRIADTIKNNNFLFSYDQKDIEKHHNDRVKGKSLYLPSKAKNGTKIDETTIIQPEMRFRPRTDLERVFDCINGNYLKNSDRQILNRQLELLDLFSSRKLSMNTLNKLEEPELINTEKSPINLQKTSPIIKEKSIHQLRKPQKKGQKRNDLNIEAKGIMSDLHYKTHFKAAEEIAEKKMIIKYKQTLNPEELPPSIMTSTGNTIILPINYSKLNHLTKHNHCPTEGNKRYHPNPIIAQAEREYESNCLASYDTYDKNHNPFLRDMKEQPDPNHMEQLKKLAFKETEESEIDQQQQKQQPLTKPIPVRLSMIDRVVNKRKKNFKQKVTRKTLEDDYSVYVGNELLHKGTQLDLIASKVLNLCNVHHVKSKHNDTSLTKKAGKLMITNGMTVDQFEKKYNFNTLTTNYSSNCL